LPESSRILAKGGNFTRQPKPSQAVQRQDHLFQARLDQQLNLQHPLVQLAQQIEWEFFEREYGALYVSDVGRPGIPTRVVVGLHYLKHAYGESDESVVARWVENPYWQYFCGYEYLQHAVPCHPTALVKWRQRLESDGIEKMLQALLATALWTTLGSPCGPHAR
jgi:IS5 family transposase